MWLLIVEALIALAMFVFIVWWTMSSRRHVDSTAVVPADPADPATRTTEAAPPAPPHPPA